REPQRAKALKQDWEQYLKLMWEEGAHLSLGGSTDHEMRLHLRHQLYMEELEDSFAGQIGETALEVLRFARSKNFLEFTKDGQWIPDEQTRAKAEELRRNMFGQPSSFTAG